MVVVVDVLELELELELPSDAAAAAALTDLLGRMLRALLAGAVRLGGMTQITPKVIEGLFASDLAYLQDVYGAINFGDPAELSEAGAPLPESPQADGG